MLAFYRRLYPFKSIFHWLNHEPTPGDLFIKREIAFNLPGEVIIRYNSFNDHDEFKKQVVKLNPTRFEIGPVYSSRVCARPSVVPRALILMFYSPGTGKRRDPARSTRRSASLCLTST